VDDFTEKFKMTLQHGKEWGNVTFVHVTKSLFNISAMRNNSRAYLDGIHASVSDASKKTLLLAQNIISLMPFGDMVNNGLGIDDLVRNVTMSDAILVTPFTYGLDVLILGPKEATRVLVTSFKHITAILVGILKKVGLLVKDIFQYVKSLFHWDDVLLNHRILTAHYEKMMRFVKYHVTASKNNFTEDFRFTLQRIGDVTELAVSSIIQGNFTSFGDLLRVATNKEQGYKTSNVSIHDPPQNVQSSFITDHMAANIQDTQFDITNQDQKSILDLTKETLRSVTGLISNTGQTIRDEMNLLVAELLKETWDFRAILSIIARLFRYLIQLIIEKFVEGMFKVVDVLLTIINRILSTKVNIPFLTPFYETVITRSQGSNLTLYDLFSLNAVLPVTIWSKVFNHGRNLFTEVEGKSLMSTQNPDDYIDNLVLLAQQKKGDAIENGNTTTLRNTYRKSVSYLLGSGYAAGQMMGALVGFTPMGMASVLGLYILRAPFEVLSILCNYPWSWYTETTSRVGLNTR
jgi:hypothetical protein